MNILTLNDIAYAYEGSKKEVFEHLSCEFEEGKIYAVVGRSGAGKTTLLSILSGLTNPTEGTVYYRDKDVSKLDRYEPEIILADEPTGNLDQETENEIMDIFQQLAQEGKCIIIVTHSKEVAEQADVIREL